MNFKIEKNIPIPTKSKYRSDFPFDKMEVGDSFFVAKEDLKCITKSLVRQIVYTAYRKYNIETDSNITLSIRLDKIKDGIRVFRTK